MTTHRDMSPKDEERLDYIKKTMEEMKPVRDIDLVEVARRAADEFWKKEELDLHQERMKASCLYQAYHKIKDYLRTKV